MLSYHIIILNNNNNNKNKKSFAVKGQHQKGQFTKLNPDKKVWKQQHGEDQHQEAIEKNFTRRPFWKFRPLEHQQHVSSFIRPGAQQRQLHQRVMQCVQLEKMDFSYIKTTSATKSVNVSLNFAWQTANFGPSALPFWFLASQSEKNRVNTECELHFLDVYATNDSTVSNQSPWRL